MFPEIRDSGLPVVKCGRGVGEQIVECGNQVSGFGNVYIQDLRAVLIQDGAVWCLKKEIVEGVACLAFLLHRFGKVVINIFRFPVGERESVFVEDCAVYNDAVSLWGAASGIVEQAWRSPALHRCAGGFQKAS